MDILKTVLTIIFVIDCIALAVLFFYRRVNPQVLERSAELQIHIGDIIKDVRWKARL